MPDAYAILGLGAVPAVFKILIVFASMLVLARVRVPLGVALALGGIALELWAGLPVTGSTERAGVLGNFALAFAEADLWLFLVITALIIELGRFMSEDDNAETIIGATRRWGGRHGEAASLIAPPAVIGLIPMPAGAVFSAPFVEQAGARFGGSADWKASVNYWFRHIWEYWWPLYPGVIVAMSVFQMEAWRYIAIQIWFTPVVLGIGYLVLVRTHVKRGAIHAVPEDRGSNRRALFLMSPIAALVGALFAGQFGLEAVFPQAKPEVHRLGALLVGMVAALAIVYVDEARRKKLRPFKAVLTKKALAIQLTLAGVLVFKFMLDRSGLLPLASEEFKASGVPVQIAVAGLPLLAGLVTGVAFGFTGTSFPLVVGIMHTPGSGLTPLATLVLAYGFGYCGMMCSPVHLCMLVTNEYFKASMRAVLRMILPCIVVVLLYAAGAHAVLLALGW
jgi:uncharacterized protein